MRLRKTHKAGRYLATQGQLPDFAGGNHTPAVAGEHYGAIEALRPLHEAAIERALHDAVAVARPATVVTAAEEHALAADPEAASEVLGVPPAEVRAFLGGEQDVWLSSCRDFFHSPFGTAGAPCPTPFWSCLSCPNAVITTRPRGVPLDRPSGQGIFAALMRTSRGADHVLELRLREVIWADGSVAYGERCPLGSELSAGRARAGGGRSR